MPTLEDYTSFALGKSLESLDPDILPNEIDILRFIVYCFDVSQAETKRMDRNKRAASVANIVVDAVGKEHIVLHD